MNIEYPEFRAWDKEEKVMCKVGIISFDDGGCLLIGNSMTETQIQGNFVVSIPPEMNKGHFCKFEDIELMEYIGLRDKNYTKIFEGDILRDRNGNIGQVWYNPSAGRFYVDSSQGCELDIKHSFEAEIIGNIHQNAELLEV